MVTIYSGITPSAVVKKSERRGPAPLQLDPALIAGPRRSEFFTTEQAERGGLKLSFLLILLLL
jgi:hypothetical protein